MSSSEPSDAAPQISDLKNEQGCAPAPLSAAIEARAPYNSRASTALAADALAGDLLAEHALMSRAAAGDIEAQRIFLDALLRAPVAHPRGRHDNLSMCEIVARLIAARGDLGDVLALASILVLRAGAARAVGDETGAVDHEARCLAMLGKVADCGNEAAAEALNLLAAECAPEAIRLAAASQRELQHG